MQIWCLAVSMLWCSLFVADLIVGMEEVELHYRCRGRSNLQKFRVATISVRMVSPLVAPYCPIPREHLSDTPLLCAMGFLVSELWPISCYTLPSPLLPRVFNFPLGEHAKSEVRYSPPPPTKGYPAKLARYLCWRQGKMDAIPPSEILSRKGGR